MLTRPKISHLSVITTCVAFAVTPAAAASTAGSGSSTATTTRQVATASAVTLANTIALDNCSGSLVRFPTSTGGDRAMLLTNGHCYEGGFIDPGVVLTNRTSSRTGKLLNASGGTVTSVRADRLLYGTMSGTDIALYRLSQSFDQLSAVGATAYTIAANRPADGSAITIPSSYWKTTYACSINGFVGTLREGGWSWSDSIRYNFPGCNTIHGTSGSPIVSNSTGEIVGINNTGNDDGKMCTDNNPCEVNPDGTTTARKGQSYGQQTYWIDTCVNSSRVLDLSVTGCKLPGATADQPVPPASVLVNGGFEAGQTGWTGSSGPITSNSGRPAHSGSWKMWLGGNGATANESEQQTFTVPNNATTLTFWRRIDTAETSTTTAYDKATVSINGTSAKTFSNLTGSKGSWVQESISLSGYAGKSVTLKFAASEDSSAQTSFVIDDVAVG